ncbi:major facilitator superfamily transporter [Histomonas meleagridis]|uniref:major facilitator superfamily transporter n=1 Tax=Histomonas meleagridis TaxID=135588 RepID=UPI00355A621D|nr:major facilitator superfamily transporter [Histomonas meleagridis]KAH0798077.1 major facilitator superfamily transporter [Histomonas meleagridis]
MVNICRIELFYTLVILFGSITFGHVMAYFSPAERGIKVDLDLNETLLTVFNTLASIGAIFGGSLMNIFVTKFGRKYPLFVTAIISFISWLCLAITRKSFYWLAFIARCICGVAIGAFSQVCPMYITELAPDELRGAFGAMNQLGVTTGSCLTYMWGIFFEWRTIAYISLIPSGLLIILIWFVKESPVYERQKNQYNDLENNKSESLFQRKFILPLLTSFLLMFFQQFSGCNALLSNLETIFKDSGSSISPKVASFLVGLAGFVSTAISTFLVEKLGRKPSWLLSSASQCVLLILAAVNQKLQLSAVIPVICLFLNNFAFGLGLGPIPWFYIPEFFPDSVRSLVCSIMTAVNWIFVSIVMFAWPSMRDSMGYFGAFLFYAAILLASSLFAIFMLKETKGTKMGGEIDVSMIEDNDHTN